MNKKMIIILGSILLTVALFLVAQSLFTTSSTNTATEPAPPNVNLVREFNNKKGPADAKVTIVEFFDPECESCQAFAPHLKNLLEQYEGKVLFVARYMLYHTSSFMAAKASQAAAKQGKFWEYHETLFNKQSEWGHKETPDLSYFIRYAEELGLDLNKFKTDMDDKETENQIGMDIADGNALGVRGTPTIFINGEMAQDLNIPALSKMINDRL